jgi:hypothetical protein
MVVRLLTACAIAAEVDCMEQRAKAYTIRRLSSGYPYRTGCEARGVGNQQIYTSAVQHSLCEPNYICQLAKCEQNNRCGWTVGDKLTDNYVGNALVFLKVCVSIFGNYQFEICYSFTGRQSSSGTNKL